MLNNQMIIDALGQAKERLILNKFSDAMVLMAQITIDVIEHLTDESLMVSKGYEEDLKALRLQKIISDDTAHNFETLIISGVQAHNGVDIPKEHATQALEVLTNELDVIFKKAENEKSEVISSSANVTLPKEKEENDVYEYDENDEPYPGDFSKDNSGDEYAYLNTESGDDDFRKKEKKRRQILSKEHSGSSLNKSKLIAIVAPIVLVILVVIFVKSCFFKPTKKPKKIKETPVETKVIETIIETTPVETMPVETEPPEPAEAGYYNVTGDLVKIRDKATTEGSRVLGTVSKGDTIQVKKFYNADWAIVVYDSEEAFISRRYIKKIES